MSSAATTLWARSFADELARLGVKEVVVAPGSRSTPLVLAFAEDGRFRLRVHLDERSAAFFALGVGKATGRPAAIVTTSGTASANVLPAVVEASQSEVPLLALTADRPPHLRDSDANQAIDQVGLYGSYVRASFDAALPTLSGPALRHLRTLAARAVESATAPPAGPVHVNFPFDKPLEPVEPDRDFLKAHPLAATGRSGDRPFAVISSGRRTASEEELREADALLNTPLGVIVAGPTADAEEVGPAVLRLAERTGFPVLADPLSGARFGPCAGAHRVAAYDLFLGDPSVAARLAPTVVVRVGASPTSAPLLRWLAQHSGVPHLVVDGGGRWKDHGATATHYVVADAARTLDALSADPEPCASEEWRSLWRSAEVAALSAIDEAEVEAHEGQVLAAVVDVAPAEATLFVSSSMPVRDLDAFGHPREGRLRVLGNRGASGIDGIVSTAFGVASQHAEPTVCVIGDIAFFHDQNGLLWSRERDASVVFVLVDNDGGAIFHMLPIAEHDPHFTEYFATPHGLDLQKAAELHGIAVHESSVDQLATALDSIIPLGQTCVVRVRTDREANEAAHTEIRRSVVAAVRATLSVGD